MALLERAIGISLNNILWATDLSVHSEAVLPYVLSLARRYDARLYVTHIVPHANSLPAKANGDLFDERRRATEDLVIRWRSLGRLHGVRHLVLVREGEAAETLCRTIHDYDIDLIVIGTRGRTGMNKMLLGSVAQELVRRVSCPMLSIGARCSGRIGEDTVVRNIVCATDLSPESLGAIGHALFLAQEHQARLTLVHVAENILAQTPDGKELLIESIQRRLEELLPVGTEQWCDLSFVVDFGVAATQILALSEKLPADLVVLGSRRNDDFAARLPGSTAYPVLSNALCPVLAVPARESNLAAEEVRLEIRHEGYAAD